MRLDVGDVANIYDYKVDIEANAKKAVELLKTRESPRGWISFISRRLGVGYNAAANIIDHLEKTGVIGGPDNTGARIILK